MKTKAKKKEVMFDAEALVQRVEGFAKATEPVREHRIKLPPVVKSIPPQTIRTIRRKLGVTQLEFAVLLNVPKVTAISWENGSRKPSGAALRLLTVVKNHPEALQTA